MARPTRDNGIVDPAELGKGMKIFTVIGPTLRDSLGAYCVRGQQAALNKEDATHYHAMNLIQVALPDFDEPKASVPPVPAAPIAETKDAGEPGTSESAEAPAAAGAADGEGAAAPAADSGGGRTSRRV